MAEITYTEVNGYQIPNLTVPHQTVQIGKYGQMRRKYLKQSRPSLYSSLMITGRITEHLLEVQTSATEQIQKIVRKLALSPPSKKGHRKATKNGMNRSHSFIFLKTAAFIPRFT